MLGKPVTKRGGGGGVAADPNAPYLSGLLLVGRLSWLLKIRGRFLEEALSSAPLSSAAASAALSADSATGAVLYCAVLCCIALVGD